MRNLTKLFRISVLVTAIGFSALFAGACKSEPPAPPPAAPPPPPIVEEYHVHTRNITTIIILDRSQNYTVQSGDTLVNTARRFYLDGSLYPLIFAASDDIPDPDRIEVDTILTIPDFALNWNDARAKKSIDELILEIAGIEEHSGRNDTAAMLRNHTK